MGPWTAPATLLILLGLAWATSTARLLPDPVPLSAPDTVFSSGRAMLDIATLAEAPRQPGTPEHAAARAYLVERLSGLGLTPEVQTATSLVRSGRTSLSVATVRNVVARIPGTASTGAVLLTAHYDSRELSLGAGDDATGVAVILETLRVLRAGPPLRNDVIVLVTDGEEIGLLGSRAFVAEHPWMQDVAVVLSVEMRGGGGPAFVFETGAENGWIARVLDRETPYAYGFSADVEVYRRMPYDTDFTPFREAGRQGLNFAAIGRPNVYHQPFDEPSRLDERTVQHHGEQVLAVARALGDLDLAQVDAPDAIFFPLPPLGLVVYPAAVGYVVAAGVVVALLLAGIRLRRTGDGVLGVAVGSSIGVAIIGLNAFAALFAFPWIARRHAEYGALRGSAFHVETWYAAALVALAFSTGTGLLSLARRRFGLGGIALGAALLPGAVALAATAIAPSMAAMFQWLALFAAASAAVVAGVGPAERPSLARWLLLLVTAAGISAFLIPLVELSWRAFGFGAAAPMGAVAAAVAVLFLPLLDVFRQLGGATASTAALAAAALFGAAGVLQADPSAERPAPSTLLWAIDHDSARALWATFPDGGEGWAAARTGAVLQEERTLAPWLPGSDVMYRTGPAPVVEVPRVELRVVADSALGTGRRRVTAAIRSPAEAAVLALRLPPGDVHLTRIAGVAPPARDPSAVSGPDRVTEVVHYGQPEGGELLVELDVGPDAGTPAIEVIEHHFGPARLLGGRWFVRPPSLAPNVGTLSDRALTRVTVPLAEAPPAAEPLAAPFPTPVPPTSEPQPPPP